eukprot:TRINITY_DN76177_c0_g1_i1.p1 TRINITY_DN76177_c0_g1~~TRINITY_DN76177_c0_g1_i1.p1  ORF type:complete len:669 (-),score=108.91 TRINITY_DN76177_c0_g1_i1:232-1938(-)
MQVSPSTLKALFDAKLRGEQLAMSLQDFQDACIVAQIERIRGRMQEHNRTLRRCAGNIDAFIRFLVLQAGDQGRRNAVARFQRKLELQFCKNLWSRLQIWAFRMTQSKGQGRDTTSIDCRNFLNLVEGTATFQAYEVEFFEHIFERVDRGRRGQVRMIDLVVTLVQMSAASLRQQKAAFLFSLFDTDSDGCLSAEQLLKLYCSLTIHGAIARGDQPSYDADILLGDELSLAKARRLYDYTLAHPSQALADDLCTFEGWWAVVEGNDRLLDDMMPGTHSLSWVLQPVAPQGLEGSAPNLQINGQAKKDPALGSKSRGWSLVRQVTTSGTDFAKDVKCQSPKEKTRSSRRPLAHSSITSVAPAQWLRQPDPETAAEKFRVHAAIRFRHAVRGEWDAVTALNAEPPASPQLPSLHRSKDAEPSTLWQEEIGSFKKRHKQGIWDEIHKTSLSDWSLANWRKSAKNPDNTVDTSAGALRKHAHLSQSLPSLQPRESSQTGPARAPSTHRLSAKAGSKNAQSQMNNFERIESVRSQIEAATAASHVETHRFGKTAMDRFRRISQFKAYGHDSGD